MTDAAQVFDALGDRTRRRVFERLGAGEMSVATLTAGLPVSQSAVSQHLKVLKDAGLVVDRPAGTRRLYRVERDGLAALRAYVDRFWDDVLDSFATFAESETASAPSSTEAPAPDRPTRRPRHSRSRPKETR